MIDNRTDFTIICNLEDGCYLIEYLVTIMTFGIQRYDLGQMRLIVFNINYGSSLATN